MERWNPLTADTSGHNHILHSEVLSNRNESIVVCALEIVCRQPLTFIVHLEKVLAHSNPEWS